MINQEINSITDLIDLEYLERVEESIAKIVGIRAMLLDHNGNPISSKFGENKFCALMHGNSVGTGMCVETSNTIIDINKETKKPSVVTCPNSGLKSIAVPIFYKNTYLGSWFIGQIRTEDIDFSNIENSVEKAGISKEKAYKIIEDITVISNEDIKNILNFFVTTTKTITDIAAANTILNKQNNELIKLTNKLDASFVAFKEFINLTDIGTYLVDYETGNLIIGSSTYKKYLGIIGEDYINHTCFSYMGRDDFCSICPKYKLIDENGEPTPPYVWERYNEGADIWLSVTSRAIKWIDGRMAIMNSFINITERKHEEERIAYLAYNDQQLDIPNAVKLNKDLSEKYSDKTFLIIFDIKGLKNINNVYGRLTGDALLCAICTWFTKIVDDNITLYRVSGDEFAVLVENSYVKIIEDLANKIFSKFNKPWIVDLDGVKQYIYSGVQVGITQITSPMDSHSTLLNLVEKILFFARDENKPIILNDEMDQKYRDHVNLIVSLKSCVLNCMEGFYLNYQPVVDAKTGKWIGVETLCRWDSPDVGKVSPNVFISEAEKLGIISTIGKWVLEKAVSQAKEWKLDKLRHFTLAVNVSPVQLRDNELVANIFEILNKYNYPTDKCILEITETAEVQFDDAILSALRDIKSSGIKLSLDDFGTGYAGFSNLRNLPISILKTDRSFVKGIEKDEYLKNTLKTMINFAHFGNLEVISEGVENAQQFEIVKNCGADCIQGYYFSKPLSKEGLEKKLENFM